MTVSVMRVDEHALAISADRRWHSLDRVLQTARCHGLDTRCPRLFAH